MHIYYIYYIIIQFKLINFTLPNEPAGVDWSDYWMRKQNSSDGYVIELGSWQGHWQLCIWLADNVTLLAFLMMFVISWVMNGYPLSLLIKQKYLDSFCQRCAHRSLLIKLRDYLEIFRVWPHQGLVNLLITQLLGIESLVIYCTRTPTYHPISYSLDCFKEKFGRKASFFIGKAIVSCRFPWNHPWNHPPNIL